MAAPQGSADVNSSISSPQIFGWVPVPGTPARIAVGFDRAKVLSRVDSEVATAALLVLLVMALAALASFPLARGIVQPLKLLTAGAEAARDRMVEWLTKGCDPHLARLVYVRQGGGGPYDSPFPDDYPWRW